ncbi:hypothetical protein [Burkholderia sp. MSMB175]|uniref:hypothetical protein n=1 Tax=Burkholderia sp. MSMB175 TaxID=1086510 RepID=UPI0011AF0854|nr:hypothetical protein [Burkholderia sp. MSMB175]
MHAEERVPKRNGAEAAIRCTHDGVMRAAKKSYGARYVQNGNRNTVGGREAIDARSRDPGHVHVIPIHEAERRQRSVRTAYYGPVSPAGEAIESLPSRAKEKMSRHSLNATRNLFTEESGNRASAMRDTEKTFSMGTVPRYDRNFA